MRIERVELFPLRLPLKEPFVTATGGFDARDLAVLKLTDSEGHVGLGEITPYPAPGSTPLIDYARGFALEVLPRLDGCDLDDTAKQLDHIRRHSPPQTLAAVDTALLDLQARVAGVR